MKTLNIAKSHLIQILTVNQTLHANEFQKTFELWRDKQERALWSAYTKVQDADTAASFNPTGVLLPMPENHAEDYARALRKLDLSVDDVIQLDENEYRQYIEDEWQWQRVFKSLSASYALGD